MIEVQMTLEQVEKARFISRTMPQSLPNSITGGEGTIAGIMGELALFDWLKEQGHNIEHVTGNVHYDGVWNGDKVDVKTKRCTSKPRREYLGSVACANTHQQCDIYAFVRVNMQTRTAWLCGWQGKETFLRHGTEYKKGDVDPDGWEVRADSFSLSYERMFEIPEYKVDAHTLAATMWAMGADHTEHVRLTSLHGDLYTYHALLWLKAVWEKNKKNPHYMNVLDGTYSIFRMRIDLLEEKEFIRNMTAAFKKFLQEKKR